jgi:(E)-4-hydroxy-3-methylbut-2-enyl-diphosphate synthase
VLMTSPLTIRRRQTRSVYVGDLVIGSANRISVQSMCATKTQDIEATVRQIGILMDHQADIIRIAIDSKKDVEALVEIRRRAPKALLVVDLQESYRLAALVAPHVNKIRYNPGHLHHHEKNIPVRDKVRFIVDAARAHECAVRIGVNFGSLDPALAGEQEDPREVALASAGEHIEYMADLDFENYVVSLKSSDPNAVIAINTEFARRFPQVPLHLGVTEAGLMPMGEIKTRVAFEKLLAQGIGDTVRVSLTLPNERKYEEVLVAQSIIADVYAGRFRSVPNFVNQGLNIISCPSCSRVENSAFVALAEKVRELSQFAAQENITVAVMGCRVNGPGETDDADLGLWCAPNHVNFKRKGELLGAFSYDEILGKFEAELRTLIAERQEAPAAAVG